MKTYEIAGLEFGGGSPPGLPKLCIPLTAGDLPALNAQLLAAEALPADLYELRADFLYGGAGPALRLLNEKSSRPVLCTLRTKPQGGQMELSPEEYESRIEEIIGLGGFQLIDIELACGGARASRLVGLAHEKGLGTVMSQHCFQNTPPQARMVETLLRMKALGADLPKLAVMPQTPGDVLALLAATLEAAEQIGPVITMSMGELGKISRVCGGLTGSCMTFGAGAEASAPGQLPADRLWEILRDLTPGKGERP